MMYPFMTLNDDTEIVRSEMKADGRVKVYVEKPDPKDGFHNFTCYLPKYEIQDVHGFSEEEIKNYMEFIRSVAHIIIEFSQDGGF